MKRIWRLDANFINDPMNRSRMSFPIERDQLHERPQVSKSSGLTSIARSSTPFVRGNV